MNYIQQAYSGKHEWWRYFVGVVIAIIGVGIFSIPHSVALLATEGIDLSQMDDMNYILSLFEPNLNLIFILLPFVGGIIFLFIAVKFLHKQSLIRLTTSRKKTDWKRVRFSFLFWGIVSSSMIVLDYYLSPDDYLLNFQLEPFLILAVIAILLVPIQTSFEEYLFRGYLMQGLGAIAKNRWFPLLMTSVVFGLMHYANPEVEKMGMIIMVYYIGTGLFLGIMTLMDEGLELALGFHAANNLFTALLVTADWTAFQTHSVLRDTSEPTAGVDILVPVLVIFPIILLVFSKKYGWSNWKEKLFGKIEEVVDVDELNELGS
ncbi:MAG: CPBP family intramembrane metalloprotease [Flavobacteriaceae bacterium]